ncbi:hypothetical protein N9Y42_10330, partial [Mariniblastus sp.]|nr:hypothetical protein [Mariniblastus sp.]
QSVGQRYHGKKTINAGVSTFTPLSRPVLNFRYRDAHATLASRVTNCFPDHHRETRLSIVVPFDMVQMEVTTGPIIDWRWAKDGKRKIVFDPPEFQATFNGASAFPVEAKRQLNKEIRWQLENLRRSSATGQLRIRTSRQSLEIAVPDDLRNCQPLDDFVRMSLKLYDLFALQETTGLNFVNDDEVQLVESMKCPICSEEIETEVVCCLRCQTPHCRDCWSYNGECATYACNETRYTEVGKTAEVCETQPVKAK